MIEPFRIDLRSLTDGQRELVELAVQQLAEAVAIDYDPANIEAISRAYRNAGAVVRALQLLQARKSAKPEPRRKRKGESAGGNSEQQTTSTQEPFEPIVRDELRGRIFTVFGESGEAKP